MYPSSHDHGNEKWGPPIVVTFQIYPLSSIFHYHDYGRKSRFKINSKRFACWFVVVLGEVTPEGSSQGWKFQTYLKPPTNPWESKGYKFNGLLEKTIVLVEIYNQQFRGTDLF